jgi:hypothetical protein
MSTEFEHNFSGQQQVVPVVDGDGTPGADPWPELVAASDHGTRRAGTGQQVAAGADG